MIDLTTFVTIIGCFLSAAALVRLAELHMRSELSAELVRRRNTPRK
jgi:hypothetical protein